MIAQTLHLDDPAPSNMEHAGANRPTALAAVGPTASASAPPYYWSVEVAGSRAPVIILIHVVLHQVPVVPLALRLI